MTEHEKYLFDLQGYIMVADALSRDQLKDLNAAFDEQVAKAVKVEATAHRFGGLLRWGEPYKALIDNPRVTPCLEEILGAHFRLDHDYADLIRAGLSPIGASLHGGNTPFSPAEFYVCRNNKIFCGLVVVAYNLRDVNPGDGGFACVPGSHKANYPFPKEWKDLQEPHPCARAVTGPAGTAIIFTEAMTHGPLPWRGKHERRTLFYKYSPHSVSWSAGYYDPHGYAGLTERQRAILEPPNARYDGRKVSLQREADYGS